MWAYLVDIGITPLGNELICQGVADGTGNGNTE